jgi:hypothetical protein
MLNRLLDEVWCEVGATLVAEPIGTLGVRANLALRIISSANAGERDPGRLKSIALRHASRRPRRDRVRHSRLDLPNS